MVIKGKFFLQVHMTTKLLNHSKSSVISMISRYMNTIKNDFKSRFHYKFELFENFLKLLLLPPLLAIKTLRY